MTLVGFFWHALNFAAPAMVVALICCLLSRVALPSHGGSRPLWQQWVWTTAAGLLVLAVGLLWAGQDGRMATYTALVLVCGTAQWWVLRASRG